MNINKNIATILASLMFCTSSLGVDAASLIKKTELNVSEPSHSSVSNLLIHAIDGEWIIDRVGSNTITREEDYPYIHFVPEEDAFYASNGCNVLNGVYTITDRNTINFLNVISTLRMCPDMNFTTEINQVLSSEKPVKAVIKRDNGIDYLYLDSMEGKNLMRLHKPGLDFLNGNWKVSEINGEKVNDNGDEMTIFFDIAERKVHGNTGCNNFNGNIYIDPVNSQRLSLSDMAVTMRMCPNLDAQRKFLVALEVATSVKKDGKHTVILKDAKGREVLKLVAVSPAQN